MTVSDIIKHIEDWAPKSIAWQKDNVGLQVGLTKQKVSNIILCLEVTDKVIDEAIKKKCNLIISHHPLLFHPLKKIDPEKDLTSSLVNKLIKSDITLFSAHTNLDFTKHGVSFELAKTLGLTNIEFLVNQKSNQNKFVVFVPEENVDEVSKAIFEAGGGIIGEYDSCSFRINGEGTFKGSDKSKPYIGKKENLEKVKEVRLEALADEWKISEVINNVLKVHPYEQPAYEVYPLLNSNVNYGIGAVGEYEKAINKDKFLNLVSKNLMASNFRYTKGKSNKIKKVAVCGGSCSELINEAIKSGADAFVTADIKYHAFHEAQHNILLIDAGHYETEVHILNEIKKRLDKILKDKIESKVFKYSGSTNPIIFYNN